MSNLIFQIHPVIQTNRTNVTLAHWAALLGVHESTTTTTHWGKNDMAVLWSLITGHYVVMHNGNNYMANALEVE